MLFLWKYKLSRGRKIHSENGHHDASVEVSKILKPSATYTPGSGFGMLEGDFLCFRTLFVLLFASKPKYYKASKSVIKYYRLSISNVEH